MPKNNECVNPPNGTTSFISNWTGEIISELGRVRKINIIKKEHIKYTPKIFNLKKKKKYVY